MGKLRDYITHLRKVDLEEVARKAVADNDSLVIDMNTSQLMEGKDSEGNDLAPYRNPDYAAFKATLNPKGVTDLKLSGDFHRGFFLRKQQFPMTIESQDYKEERLTKKYGEQIFGLNQENKEELAKSYVLPECRKAILLR
jgi:hypothetical protein